MKKQCLVALLVFAMMMGALVFLPNHAPSAQAQGPQVRGPFVAPPVIPVSFDGDVRRLPRLRASGAAREIPRPRRAPIAQFVIPTIPNLLPPRAPARTQLATSPLVSFKGLDEITWGQAWPPDPNGDVGPNHYVQAVNLSVGIFNKNGALLAAATFDDFFSGLPGPCGAGLNRGDPIALYDPVSDRWIIINFAWSDFFAGPYYECIAVSKTSDPVSGGWWRYAFQADANYLNDYPKLAVWADGIYMSANMFDEPGDIDRGVKVWAFDRNELINGAALNPIFFTVAPGVSTLLPANLRGDAPPSGTPEFFASISQPNLFHLWKFHTDWTVPANSTFTAQPDITVADFAMPCNAAMIFACVPQLGGESLDGLGDRLMMQLQYRHIAGTESLWVNHTVAASQSVGYPTGIRWYEIRDPNGAPTVYQQGTYQPDSNYRWMGSLAVDRFGNMALGYSVSSASMYPAIRYTGRLASDPVGTLTQGEISLIEGTGAQSNRFNRWGDYSAMTVDPVDDCTFWYTNEYYETTGWDWQTRIGSFMLPGCPHLYILPQIFKNAP